MDEEKQGAPPPGGELPQGGAVPYSGNSYGQYEDPYGYNTQAGGASPSAASESTAVSVLPAAGGVQRPPAPPPPPLEIDDADEGMARMSFMEHLEELRSRIIKAVLGLAVAFIGCMLFSYKLWEIISEPAVIALQHLHVNPPKLAMIQPLEGFSIIWIKLPLLASVFVASPWILYQVWAFVAPGLYRKERRWAIPFIFCTAGLFITGGLFAYFLAFRYGLEFLLGIGMMNNVQPVVTITEYFDLFVNVVLGVALVFEMPMLIFFLTLLKIVSPRFLLRHSRYAILAITVAAAIITPTPDFFNMMLFAVPMTLLYFVGVFAGYIVMLKREGKRLPWGKISIALFVVLALAAGGVFLAITRYGFRFLPHWPFVTR